MSLFTKLKDLDIIATRGSRTVYGGLQNPAGQELLQHYLLSSGSRLETLLKQKVLFDWTSGLTIPDFDSKGVSYPGGATHLGIQLGHMTLNFENYTSTFGCSDMVYLSPNDLGTIAIPAPALAVSAGTHVGVVFSRFVQEMNGQYYPLKNEKSMVLEVVALRQAQ